MTTPVTLYVYDLSNGVARTISPFILGRRIEGLWHTAIVVFGNEYFFGGGGIACCMPGTTQLGPPLKQEMLGLTAITQDVFEDYLVGYSNSKFHGSAYHILENNCNNFSDEVAKFLIGTGIDEEIVSLPQKVISSPLGPLLKSQLEKMSNVAPTDTISIKKSSKSKLPSSQSKKKDSTPNGDGGENSGSSAAHCSNGGQGISEWDNSALYFPSFCPVELGPDDITILNQVDAALVKSIERGPFTTDDMRLLCVVHAKNQVVFMRVVALLLHKPGFVRLVRDNMALFTLIKQSLSGEAGLTESSDILSNNLLSGFNQCNRCDAEVISCITNKIVMSTLVDASITITRIVYNLSGSTLTEDQVMELGSALIFSLPDSNTLTPSSPDREIERVELLLKSLYLLMIRSRQIADLCAAMDKNVAIFRNIPQLSGVVDKIAEIQS